MPPRPTWHLEVVLSSGEFMAHSWQNEFQKQAIIKSVFSRLRKGPNTRMCALR
jgi:hypothetical protein